MRVILGAGAVWESEPEGTVHGTVEAKRAFRGQSGRRMGMRAKNHAVHRHRSAGSVIEGSAGIVHRRSYGWMFDRQPARMLRLVPMLQQPRYVLGRSTAVLVRPSEVMIVNVIGVILQPAGMLYGAHHSTTIHAAR